MDVVEGDTLNEETQGLNTEPHYWRKLAGVVVELLSRRVHGFASESTM